MKLRLSKTYDVVTEASAAEGDAAEQGFNIEDEPTDVRDVIDALSGCSEVSVWPVRSPADLTGREWASTEPERDPGDGSYRTTAIHVRHLDGRPLTPRQLCRLFRAAGLVTQAPAQARCDGTWDRFDICEAWYVFAAEYHDGQGSDTYRIFGQLDQIRFRPSPRLSRRTLSPNGRAILAKLIRGRRRS